MEQGNRRLTAIATRAARVAGACVLLGALLVSTIATAPVRARRVVAHLRVRRLRPARCRGRDSIPRSPVTTSPSMRTRTCRCSARSGTLQAARPDIGDVVVLDFGYNDGPDPGVWRGRVDQAMAILAGVPKVIWLGQSDFANGRADMNAQLVAATQQYPNLEYVDWNAVVAANPGALYGDGVHLTPVGQAAMADVVRLRVDAFVAARVAATSTTVAPTTTVPPTTTTAAKGEGKQASAMHPPSGDDSSDAPWIAVGIAVVALLVVAAAVVVRARRRTRRGPARP